MRPHRTRVGPEPSVPGVPVKGQRDITREGGQVMPEGALEGRSCKERWELLATPEAGREAKGLFFLRALGTTGPC